MTETGLSLGSNLGDRLENLKTAKRHIAALPGIQLVAQSAVYETEPVDVPPEYNDIIFLNSILIIQSRLLPGKLMKDFRDIELTMKKETNTLPNAPRIIDIDIIYSGSEKIQAEHITVPHPRWAERRFVVQPLQTLRPDLVIAGETRTVKQIFLALPPAPKVLLFKEDW